MQMIRLEEHYYILQCQGNLFGIAKYLVDNGDNDNSRDLNEWTTLHHECNYSRYEIVKYIVEHGVDINENFI